jgi:phosphatidate cytidylyltransferase
MAPRAASPDPALGRRVVSALALIPIALGMLLLGPLPFAALVGLAVALMALEWQRLIAARFDPQSGRVAGWAALLGSAVALVLAAGGWPREALVVLGVAVGLAAGVAAWLGARPLWAGLGVAYLGVPAVALVWLRSDPERGLGLLIWLLAVVWAADTFAYVVGRWLGGPKLAPSISPAKTWSGLCGSVLGGALVGGLGVAVGSSGRTIQAVGLGAVLALVGQVGDLVESAFKRRAGVKDSGRAIPGHGGVLDRLDSLLFAAPALALLALLLGPEALLWH